MELPSLELSRTPTILVTLGFWAAVVYAALRGLRTLEQRRGRAAVYRRVGGIIFVSAGAILMTFYLSSFEPLFLVGAVVTCIFGVVMLRS